jgi:hypothetical protein
VAPLQEAFAEYRAPRLDHLAASPAIPGMLERDLYAGAWRHAAIGDRNGCPSGRRSTVGPLARGRCSGLGQQL